MYIIEMMKLIYYNLMDLDIINWIAIIFIIFFLLLVIKYILSGKKTFAFVSGKYKYMMPLLAIFFFLCGWITGTIKPSQIPQLLPNSALQHWPPREGVLASVKENGYLRCGINIDLKGFSEIPDLEEGSTQIKYYPQAYGFDADFCRVVAAAIFGDPRGRIQFLPLRASDETDWLDRFAAVENGYVDVLFRNTSATAGREFGRSVVFGPTTFYDRQSFLVTARSEISSLEDLRDLDGEVRICVTGGTTTQDNLRIALKEKFGIKYNEVTTTSSGNKIEDSTSIIGSLVTDHCDMVTGDFSQLATFVSSGSDYKIVHGSISKELLSPMSVKGDKQWSDIIKYAVYATIEAAELEIKKRDIPDRSIYLLNESSSYKKTFLGLGDSENIGEYLGLTKDFARNIISHVGNYDDIYENNLLRWPSFEKRGPNQVVGRCDKTIMPDSIAVDSQIAASLSNCGLLISPPFTDPS